MTNGLPVCRFSGHQRMDSAFTRASPIRCEPEGVQSRVCAGCALGLCRDVPDIAVPVAALRSPQGGSSSASCHFVDEQRSSERASGAQGLPSRQRGTSTAIPCNPMLRSAPVRGKVLCVGLVSSRPIPRHGRYCNEAASQAQQDRPRHWSIALRSVGELAMSSPQAFASACVGPHVVAQVYRHHHGGRPVPMSGATTDRFTVSARMPLQNRSYRPGCGSSCVRAA
jgi:hypothetical protein